MKTFKNIVEFINSKIFLIIIIIVLLGYASIQTTSLYKTKIDNLIKEQNIEALNDSIRLVKKQNNTLEFSITSFIASEKELKKLNEDLYKKVKAQDGKIMSLTSSVIKLKQDSITLQKALNESKKIIEELKQIDSNTFVANWTLPYDFGNNNYDIFKGSTYIKVLNKSPLLISHFDTKLISRETQINLIWGQKIENNKLRIFVESNYPGFTVESLQGVLIDPNDNKYIKSLIKQRRWFNGFHVGVGITGGYDILDRNITFVFGPTLTYSFFKL